MNPTLEELYNYYINKDKQENSEGENNGTDS